MASVVEKKEMAITKMGIDMSRAFDTIMRNTIVNLLKECGCTEDEIRIVKMLLSNTNLRVKVEKTLSLSFEVTLGSFQGDSLSAKLFTLYLAGAMNHLRMITNMPNPPVTNTLMPSETQYADDCDFYDIEENTFKEHLFPAIQKTFEE